jgi:Zn-dependent M28 family amino/carboxypeptidase
MQFKSLTKIFTLFVLFLQFNLVAQKSDTTLIYNHLESIVQTDGFRNYKDTTVLNEVASYVFKEFSKYADTTFYQYYFVQGVRYQNVVARINNNSDLPKIIIGAHYDVCGNQEGADDNASGLVGLLETSRLISGQDINYTIEFVAYTLEEPPFFRTEYMGSFVHAEQLINEGSKIYGMISLEMIGFFSDEPNSQNYPLNFLKVFYGKKGNFITLVNCLKKGRFAKKFSNSFLKNKFINSKNFRGPKSLTGIDFSDHLNYWSHDISALMITDTAFYRNKNYHERSDTIETLDVNRMSHVIDALVETLLDMK